MNEVTISRMQEDAKITSSDIPLNRRFEREEDLMSLFDEIRDDEYVSIPNRNNLTENLIYRKERNGNDFKESKSFIDTTWYNENERIFHIHNASELRGIHTLVCDGVDFRDKFIYLYNDIDLSEDSWIPIGSPSLQDRNDKYRTKGVFRGTFDGLNHTIYNLHNDKKIPYYAFAFFLSVDCAKIKNVIFKDVDICSYNGQTMGCAIAVHAERTLFSDIYVSGMISAEQVCSITQYAKDSAFNCCRNSAHLISDSHDKSVIVGGICSNIEITEAITDNPQFYQVRLFHKCANYGQIEIYGDITSLYAGHIFGNLICEDSTFLCIIEKCRIVNHNYIKLNGTTMDIDDIYFGCDKKNKKPVTHINENYKTDLLGGLIGRVQSETNIKVVNIVESKWHNNNLIPGSCNTLMSTHKSHAFQTVRVDNIPSTEYKYDLEPCFTFIKSTAY